VASALPAHRFAFEGFLPKKKGRQSRLERLAGEERTMVFYESPHRLMRTLADLSEAFAPERRAAVARELTKRYEEIQRGTLSELRSYFSNADKVRGEIVLVVAGA
ncbi:MAG: 16S rRNA (cytidine(1402)-2'-O)-methyltransferase, partial [Bacteroidetes bacterium QH_2_67_10]